MNTIGSTCKTLLLFKTDRGVRDIWHEATRSIATREEWEKREPELRATFESYLTRHNYITCRGCHSLQSFAGPRSQMKRVIHQGLATQNNYNCLECHSNIGHVYVESAASPNPRGHGWYTDEQAVAGEQLFEHSCSPCHGTKLEGMAGAPALSGARWKQHFAGTKLLAIREAFLGNTRTLGVLANNVWSVAGDGSRPAVNQFLLQYFIN
jgi:hypothetical protein